MIKFWHGVDGIEAVGNQLLIGGVSAKSLVEQFGSPLYVYVEERILDNAKRLTDAFTAHYGNYQLLYAVKANNNLKILKILNSSGVGADASHLRC